MPTTSHKLVCNEKIGYSIMDIMDKVVDLERRVRFDPRFILLNWYINMTETEYLNPMIKFLLKGHLSDKLIDYWVDNGLICRLVIDDTVNIPYIDKV